MIAEKSFISAALAHCATSLKRGSEWPAESIALALDCLNGVPKEAVSNGIKRVFLEFSPGHLPPIQKIVDVINVESGKLNLAAGDAIEREWKQKKQEPSRFGERSGKHAEHAGMLVEKIVAGTLSHNRIVDAMEYMEKTYPGVGWREECSKLISFWRLTGAEA